VGKIHNIYPCEDHDAILFVVGAVWRVGALYG
jgi:hypothetical protein